MGGCRNVFVKSAVILVLGVLVVNGYENDDLVFDQDGKSSAIEVPLIQRQAESTVFQRIKRGIFDWFQPENPTTTESTPIESTSTEEPETETLDPNGYAVDPEASVEPKWTKTYPKGAKGRKIRESGEENSVNRGNASPKNENDIIGEFAAGHSDDEDLVGSGEVEGSATEGDGWITEPPRHNAGQARFYRVTITVLEPFTDALTDRNSQEYKELAGSLVKGIETLYHREIPGSQHFANVVKISRLDDAFTSEVTLDIGSTFDGEDEVRIILEEQLQYHTLGGIPVDSKGFTFRNFQGPGEPECNVETELTCRDGSCVPLSARCDNIYQCPDSSDELDCPNTVSYNNSRCGNGEFACDVSRCILDSQRCDFNEDCEDGSDEQSCTYPICTQSEFKCRNGQCLEASLRCNGINDCRDESDEKNCPCKDDQFECTPLYCISLDLRCDGVNHCSNGRDEQDCEKTNSRCKEDEFECGDGSCVNNRVRCDGRSDCPDRSDERNCTVTTCSSDQYRCQDGTCLGIAMRCDGRADCRNGEDESQCGCGPSELTCGDGQCVPYKLQCNGVNDCRDGSDERDCEKGDWCNFYNAEKCDHAGKIKIRRPTSPEVLGRYRHRGSKYRDEIESRRKSSVKTANEIPSAGKIDDPTLAAYPELASLLSTIFVKSETKEDDGSDDWEFIDVDKNSVHGEKSAKSKTVSRNVDDDFYKLFGENRRIVNGFLEAYPDLGIDTEDNYEDFYDEAEVTTFETPATRRTDRNGEKFKSTTSLGPWNSREEFDTRTTTPRDFSTKRTTKRLPENHFSKHSTLSSIQTPKKFAVSSTTGRSTIIESEDSTNFAVSSDRPKTARKLYRYSKDLSERDPSDMVNIILKNRQSKMTTTTIAGTSYDVKVASKSERNESVTGENMEMKKSHGNEGKTRSKDWKNKTQKKKLDVYGDVRVESGLYEGNSAKLPKRTQFDEPVEKGERTTVKTWSKEKSDEESDEWEFLDVDKNSVHEEKGGKSKKFAKNVDDNFSKLFGENRKIVDPLLEAYPDLGIDTEDNYEDFFDEDGVTTFETPATRRSNLNGEKFKSTTSLGPWNSREEFDTRTTTPRDFSAKRTTTRLPENHFSKYSTLSSVQTPKKFAVYSTTGRSAIFESEDSTNFAVSSDRPKTARKLYRYSKDLSEPDPSDIVNVILKKRRSKMTITTIAGTTNDVTPTSTTQEPIKVEKKSKSERNIKSNEVFDKIHKISVGSRDYSNEDTSTSAVDSRNKKTESKFSLHLNKHEDSTTASTTPLTTTDSTVSTIEPKTARKLYRYSKDLSEPDPSDMVDIILKKMRSKTKTTTIAGTSYDVTGATKSERSELVTAKKRYGIKGKPRSKDWKNKRQKKKLDPYDDVKVETGLYERKSIKLPKRMHFDESVKKEETTTKGTTIETSQHNPENCSATCADCWKKMQVELIDASTEKAVEYKNTLFEENSNENVDSGLIESSVEHGTISNPDVESIFVDHREVESIAATKKPTKSRTKPLTVTTSKIQVREPMTTMDSFKPTKKKKKCNKRTNRPNGKKGNRRNCGNGRRRRNKKTTPMATERLVTTVKSSGEVLGTTRKSLITNHNTMAIINRKITTDIPANSISTVTSPTEVTKDCGFFGCLFGDSSEEKEVAVSTSKTPTEVTTSEEQTNTMETTVQISAKSTKDCGLFGCSGDESSEENIGTVKTTTVQISAKSRKDCGLFGCWGGESSEENNGTVKTPSTMETTVQISAKSTKDCGLFGCWGGHSSEENNGTVKTTTNGIETTVRIPAKSTKDCGLFGCSGDASSEKQKPTNAPETSIFESPTIQNTITSKTRPTTATSSFEAIDEPEFDSSESSETSNKDLESNDSSDTSETILHSQSVESKGVIPSRSQNNDTSVEFNVSEEITSLHKLQNAKILIASTPWNWLFQNKVQSTEAAKLFTVRPPIKQDNPKSVIFPTFSFTEPSILPLCPAFHYRCDHDRCIHISQICDGKVDCHDRSDENDCGWRRNRIRQYTDSDRCRKDQHPCDTNTCLEEENTCDGIPHCADGTDENNCDDYNFMKNKFLNKHIAKYRSTTSSATTSSPFTVRPSSTRGRCHPELEFRCDNGKCIDDVRLCDGYYDCANGEDENDSTCLETQYCPDGELPCDNGVCISKRFFCDRNVDCHDGSDEKDCPDTILEPYPPRCRSDEFTCNDGSCIPGTSRCDGRADCPDDEDERECRRGCSRDQFQCQNGDCINNSQKCNGFIDCEGGADEEGCEPDPAPSHHCSSDQFTCTFDRTCVHYSSRCNGIPDCRDRSDEDGCDTEGERKGLHLKTYPSEQIIKESREVVFQCRDEGPLRAKVHWLRGNGLPLPPGSRDINGRLEIPNVQLDHGGIYICEAVGYPSSTSGQQLTVYLEVEKFEPPATRPPQVCKYDQATCSNGDCVPKSFVCDGKFDCTDGSDEMRCNPHGCEPNQFRCANKQCVSKIWRCDGDKDCADGSDEENCAPPPPGSPCRYDEYACSNYGQCIPKSYHCDMERDCQDGSDELGCSPVYITVPPPAMVNLHPGDTMILTCTAIGVPIPEINWRLNWGHVPSKCYSTSINGTGTLTCPDIQISDQGAYSCEAINIGGFVFAVPDAILVVDHTGPDVCPPGKFNSEARTPDQCISCFCFGVTDKCTSANLFTYQLPPPFDRHRLVTVETTPELRIHGEVGSQVAEVRPVGLNGAEITAPYNTDLTSYNVPYFALPKNYFGSSQLRSYGGYLKYTVSYSGNGAPNSAPDVVISGNGFTLIHRGRPLQPDAKTERSVRFFYGEWMKYDRGQEIPATRQEIMMVLAKVDQILIKAKYEDSPELQVSLTDIVMDTAGATNTGQVASFVEECRCPTGYTGESCEGCAPGYRRRQSGAWLGECYRDEPPCPPGYYGDPSRNIPCMICPCPLTNPSNQFGRTCRLGADRNPICDCPPGYVGARCEQCAQGYHGNPLIPGDMCVRDEMCDPHGSITSTPDADGKCRCKQYATGLKCDQCKANTFNRASKNQFGCISCFCMGITNRCSSSNWYRNEVRVSFTNSIRDFTLVESNTPNAQPISEDIRLDTIAREIVYNAFPNRGNTDVYYWQLPSIFLGNQITSYGGELRYTVRYVPSPGGQSSRNNAADVELISANDINLLYFSRETPESHSPQSFTVPLLEQYWQRTDGTQADREHLLMALADVQAIRIKATYTTHTDEAALSLVALDIAEKYNTGKSSAVEVEECTCPAGYRGLSCEDCAVGYTRAIEGLYLGICEPCNCNGHSSQCDPETGVCENCADHTTGDNCDICEPGYEGDATQGSCRRTTVGTNDCHCDPAGSDSDRCIDGRCVCKQNVEGQECNRCRPSTFGLSAENTNGCNECYCSGVTNQCQESSLVIQQIPMWVYDSRHGFTLTDSSRLDVIDDGFDLNVASNEIGYRFSSNRNRRLFWSLPATFTGNRVKSYGGNLTLTQHITAHPNAQTLKDQDVLLTGNGITLFWVNPQEIVPGIPMTYSVPMRESEWRRLSSEGPRRASRTDFMTVLSNLEAILVRASHSEGMTATYISDISLDTAVEGVTSNRRATQIEACRCPQGYSGTSCETCARGYYRDINDRSVSILGSCNLCPCNDQEESCEIGRSGHVKCHCISGYTGQYCQDIVDYPPVPPPPPSSTITPPRILVSIQEKKFQIVQTGNTVRYHCTGRSADNAPLHIRWSKEGSPLPERSIDDAHGVLILRDVKVSDSGIYVCQVSDGNSIAVEKVTLTVGGSNPVKPRAIIRPQYQQVKEGEPVEFVCEASGNPQPEIEWIRVQGRMNPEATFHNGVWRIPAVSKSDAAEYKCIARNEVGINEQTTIVYVLDNPNRPPPNTGPNVGPSVTPSEWTGTAGDTVRLICARSNYQASVLWVRSGALQLPLSANQHNGVLTIGNPVPSDSGIYICTATSHQGAETSTFANITIFPRRIQPSVRVEPERQTISQGMSAEVRCIADRDSGLQIKWIKYGEPSIGPNARQIGDTLVLTNPQVADRGVYICRASNAAGSYEASAIVEVEPRETPILELYPQKSQTANIGGSADLQCRVVAGFPVPEVHWIREDGRQFGSNIQQLPGGLLRLTNITIHDGGAYKCSASNIVGSTSAIARIEVQSIPVITILPAGGLIYAKPGSRVRLTCSAQGIPQPNVAWMKSTAGVSVYNFAKGLDSSHLTAVHEIMSMSPNDEGSYTCQAVNAAGITEERIKIRIEDDNGLPYPEPCRGDVPGDCEGNRPDHTGGIGKGEPGYSGGVRIPEDYLKIPHGGKVEIRCQVFEADDSQIYLDWRRSDRRPLPSGATVHNGILTIPDITKDAAGEYVCLGLNHAGSELFRAKSHLEVISPPRIELNPNRQTVGPGESPAIVCTATGDQPLTLEWEAIGRPLPYSVSHDRGILQFHGITYSDAGKYVCKARNDAGTAEAVAEVLVSENVFDDTGIRAVERDVTTFAGNSVRLRCEIRERSTIEWSKDGRPLPRNAHIGENYIELTRVQPEDAGKYTCQIRNNHGVSSDYINLRVEEAVNSAVTIDPSQDVVNIGDMIDLRCTYTGTQSPRYRWSRPNHASLPPNALEHGNILRISNIELSESGVYRCHADTSEGSYDEDYNLIVQGGTNDAPAIETKYVPYGSSLEMGCRMDLEPPIKFQWSKLGGLLPHDTETFDNKLKLINVKADDAGTYICRATNGIESSEVPTVLVVTGVVPNFNQAPQSWISLPPLPESYLKFNIEVSFKPESDDGIILYNDETTDGTGDFIVLSLTHGYPEFKFDLGSGVAVIRADKPVSLSEWHTIKLQRNRKEGTMLVDGEGPYKAVNPGRKQGLDLKKPLYIGGVPDYNSINKKAEANAGFVGCISRLVLGEKTIDLIGDQTNSVGVTTCETCAENPCNNAGVCQEASTKNGYKCLCRAGYSGKHCDSTGQSCYPGACNDGTCVNNEHSFECYCPRGKSGSRCELFTANLNEPAFRDDRAYLAYSTPMGIRRADKRNAIKAKRSHARRSSHVPQLRKGRSRSAHLKHHNVQNTKH